MKSHLTKFNSKTKDIREGSAFFKHLQNSHGGQPEGKHFSDCFNVKIVKAYNKPITRQTEECTFMINTEGELLNLKTEWHQPKIVRTEQLSTLVVLRWLEAGYSPPLRMAARAPRGPGLQCLHSQWMENRDPMIQCSPLGDQAEGEMASNVNLK